MTSNDHVDILYRAKPKAKPIITPVTVLVVCVLVDVVVVYILFIQLLLDHSLFCFIFNNLWIYFFNQLLFVCKS